MEHLPLKYFLWLCRCHSVLCKKDSFQCLGTHVRAWKRGIAILTAGNVKLSPDERLSLVHGYDLEIRHIKPEDEGDYVCQIATLQPQEITHTVEVLEKFSEGVL
uniref:Uncharacterized protein n=1 Tax=Rhodnius prolixus TaxID=13249 RepID=T1HUS8_RHOPR